MASRFSKPLIPDGARYGLLTVVRFAGRKPLPSGRRTHPTYLCRCDCGKERVFSGRLLKAGSAKSCGCARAAAIAESKTRHGHSAHKRRSRAYRAWSDMLDRCRRPSHVSFKNYGARGIQVCEEWRGFDNFLRDMGEPPEGAWLDRIDSDGRYEKSNCRWATIQEQQNNRRNNVRVDYQGKTITAAELARIAGLPQKLVQERLRNGFAPEQAVFHGRLKYRRKKKLDSVKSGPILSI